MIGLRRRMKDRVEIISTQSFQSTNPSCNPCSHRTPSLFCGHGSLIKGYLSTKCVRWCTHFNRRKKEQDEILFMGIRLYDYSFYWSEEKASQQQHDIILLPEVCLNFTALLLNFSISFSLSFKVKREYCWGNRSLIQSTTLAPLKDRIAMIISFCMGLALRKIFDCNKRMEENKNLSLMASGQIVLYCRP